jgi:rRNA pseudouridine-1189 N-methylase Emg1 (Nep1/Mra1 family)
MHDLFAKFALNTDKFVEDKNIKFIQVIKHPKGNSAKRVVEAHRLVLLSEKSLYAWQVATLILHI